MFGQFALIVQALARRSDVDVAYIRVDCVGKENEAYGYYTPVVGRMSLEAKMPIVCGKSNDGGGEIGAYQ